MNHGQSSAKGAPAITEASTEARPPLDPLGLAWAGGFIDGEGCIYIAKELYANREPRSYRLCVSVTQNDIHSLEHLRRVVGVHAQIYPVKRASNHRRQCYTLNYTGKHALQLLVQLRDFLVRKRAEALTALEFCKEGRIGARFGSKGVSPALMAIREQYFQLMKQLK